MLKLLSDISFTLNDPQPFFLSVIFNELVAAAAIGIFLSQWRGVTITITNLGTWCCSKMYLKMAELIYRYGTWHHFIRESLFKDLLQKYDIIYVQYIHLLHGSGTGSGSYLALLYLATFFRRVKWSERSSCLKLTSNKYHKI